MNPATPFITYYDDSTGERVELSTLTFDNWVAKTANLLRDELGIGQGDAVGIALPTHWVTSVWLAAAWQVGATVYSASTGIDPSLRLDLAVIGPGDLDDPPAAGELVGCALRPMGQGFQQPPRDGILDYATDVRGHGDFFGPVELPLPDQPALVVGGIALTMSEVSAAAQAAAAAWGLPLAGRLLVSKPRPISVADWLGLYPIPHFTGGSVVLASCSSTDALVRIFAQERVDVSAPTG